MQTKEKVKSLHLSLISFRSQPPPPPHLPTAPPHLKFHWSSVGWLFTTLEMSGNWTELTFLKSSGTATGDRGNNWLTLILLQIVVASPGTHLVKNYESQSRTNEFQFSLKLKMLALGLYVTRPLIWRQTPKLCITVLQYTEIENNIVLLFKSTRLKETCIVKQQS